MSENTLETIKELVVVCVMKKPLPKTVVGGFIGKFLSSVAEDIPGFLDYHNKNTRGTKHYSFSNFLQPPNESGFYDAGTSYSFAVRSLDIDFLKSLKEQLETKLSEHMFIINVSLEEVPTSSNYFVTTTPVIMLNAQNKNNLYFVGLDDMEIFKNELEKRMCKYYRKMFLPDMNFFDHSFIESVQKIHEYPMVSQYKSSHSTKPSNFLGYRIAVKFKNDELSQKIMKFCICVGFGEKTSFVGSGYMKPVFRNTSSQKKGAI